MAFTGGFQRVSTSIVAFDRAETLPGGMAWDGSKLFMPGASNDWLYEVNRTTSGAARVGRSFRFGRYLDNAWGLTWDDTNLLMTDLKNLYRVSRTEGGGSNVSTIIGFGENIVSARDLAWDGTNLFMLALAVKRASAISGTPVHSPAEDVYNTYRALLVRSDVLPSMPKILSQLRRDQVQNVLSQNPALINLAIGNSGLLATLGVNVDEALLNLLDTDTSVQNFLRDPDVQALMTDLENSFQLQLLLEAEMEAAGPYGLIAGLYKVNRNTEIATQVGTLDGFGVGATSPTGLEWVNSQLIMVDEKTKAMYTLNTTTGAATRVGNIAAFGLGISRPGGLGWDGTHLFMSERDNGSIVRALESTDPALPTDTTPPTMQVGTISGEQSEAFSLVVAATDNQSNLTPANVTVTQSPSNKVTFGPVIRGALHFTYVFSVTPVAATSIDLPAEDVDITVTVRDNSGNMSRETVTVRLAARTAPVAPPTPTPQQAVPSGTQFFSTPLNYGNGRSQYPEVADNDYNTYTEQTSMLLNIDTTGDGTGDAREFTDIFLKGTGIARYTAAFTDGVNLPNPSPFPRTPPATVKNDSGDTVETTVDGFQHDLHTLWTDERTLKPKATAITITVTAKTGETPRIYEVMILNRLLTLNSDGGLSRIEYDSIDLGAVEPDLRKRLSYVPPIGGERDKWLANLTLLSPRVGTERDTLADQMISFIRRYKNFVFAAEYNRQPDLVFPALWPNPETQIRYLSKWKGSGRRVLLSIREA